MSYFIAISIERPEKKYKLTLYSYNGNLRVLEHVYIETLLIIDLEFPTMILEVNL